MSIIKVEIIDRDKENREFIEKTIFFFKYFFLPVLTFIVIAIFLENLFIALISPLLVLGIIIFRKKIFNKHTGKPYWVGIGIIILILIILYFLPTILSQINSLVIGTKHYDVKGYDFNYMNDVDKFCDVVCASTKSSDGKNFIKHNGGGYFPNVNALSCNCIIKEQSGSYLNGYNEETEQIYVDYSGKRITKEEVVNKLTIDRKAHGQS